MEGTNPHRRATEDIAGAPRFDVSVLVPSFNSGPFIARCVCSALDQPGASVEVIVQDGGSTDGTVDALAALDDPRVQTVVEPDDGQSDALNRALRRATGEFVIWLNADDLLAEGALGALLGAARSNELALVHGGYQTIDADGAVIKDYTSAPLELTRLIRHGTYIFSGALLIRRSLLIDAGGFDDRLHYCMDYDLLFRVAKTDRARGEISDVVAQFRRQPESKSESSSLPFLREWLLVGRRHGATMRDSARTTAMFIAYMALRPLWRSRLWLRARPRKQLGGR
jgi:glycosyltransferase involved in cell wall biosynthesis